MKRENVKDLGKKVRNAAIASATAGSLIVNSVYDSPEDIVKFNDNPDGLVEDFKQSDEDKVKNRIKNTLGRMPSVLKAVVLVPMWCVGWFLMATVTPLFNRFGVPILKQALEVIVAVAVILLLVAITLKFIFPQAKLTKLLSKKTIFAVVILTVLVKIADEVLMRTSVKYQQYATVFKVTAYICIGIAVIILRCFVFNNEEITVSTDQYQLKVTD